MLQEALALAELNAVLTDHGKAFFLLDPIGQALAHNKHYEEAAAIYHRALDLIGSENSEEAEKLVLNSRLHDRAVVLIHLGEMRVEQGERLDEALAAGQEALGLLTRISPRLLDRAECLRMLGRCYEELGNKEEALVKTGEVPFVLLLLLLLSLLLWDARSRLLATAPSFFTHFYRIGDSCLRRPVFN